MKIVNARKGYIGIEANKPDVIKEMEKLLSQEANLDVVGLKRANPKVLKNSLFTPLTKRKVPAGGLPMAVVCGSAKRRNRLCRK
jgi:electron transport complex protein RnfC